MVITRSSMGEEVETGEILVKGYKTATRQEEYVERSILQQLATVNHNVLYI